ncbi:hypothetical protein HANVADRAFT_42773 [Hanseniaspora valbyensis NRRL Y-1626]|uniref:Uncharacterized protein n=1 Tax=Hanseniaspora valbyensis NRRL Y-1626 TaxID=766949 RepID=A0A1B7T7V9_9ASCO|nr:hypothetical protein HANVADRAFT_42773 [Hanseniaspora valbyensis NRRL Y-1626]
MTKHLLLKLPNQLLISAIPTLLGQTLLAKLDLEILPAFLLERRMKTKLLILLKLTNLILLSTYLLTKTRQHQHLLLQLQQPHLVQFPNHLRQRPLQSQNKKKVENKRLLTWKTVKKKMKISYTPRKLS